MSLSVCLPVRSVTSKFDDYINSAVYNFVRMHMDIIHSGVLW